MQYHWETSELYWPLTANSGVTGIPPENLPRGEYILGNFPQGEDFLVNFQYVVLPIYTFRIALLPIYIIRNVYHAMDWPQDEAKDEVGG